MISNIFQKLFNVYKIKSILYKNFIIGGDIIKSKIVFTALILFILISLTCVSAAEDNHTDVVGDVSDSVTDVILTEENDDTGNFTNLNNLIAGTDNELKLEKDYTYDSSKDSSFKNGIVIDKDNYVIDGDYHTINGDSKAIIFKIQADNVTLKNINFIGGFSYGNSGAIYATANLTVLNCNFTNNYASYGGGIYINGVNASLTVKDSYFEGNTGASIGSSIYASLVNGSFIVEDCRFNKNSGYYAGAVYASGALNKAIMKNCNFTDNKATGINGGALYICNPILGIIENCNFYNNQANGYGGAGFFSCDSNLKCNLTIRKSNFINNTASVKYAGALVLNVNTTIEDCNFINNSASTQGGALYFEKNGNVKDCYFAGNDANTGGAIYLYGDLTISDSTFKDNTATSTKTCIIGLDDNANLTTHNTTPNVLMYDDFTALQSRITDSGSNYISLNSNYIYDSSTDSSYKNGVVITQHDLVIDGNGCTISGSNAARIFNIEGNNVTLKNINFINGYGEFNGGAVYLGSNGTITNCNFANNTALKGGAVYASEVVIRNSNFNNNLGTNATGTVYGGAVYVENDGVIEDSNFTNNYVMVYSYWGRLFNGGAIFFNGTGTVANCNFINNSARNGGAVYFENKSKMDTGIINNCIFINNTCESYGGAVYFANTGTVESSIFEGNNANYIAGAICSFGKSRFNNCIFKGNEAPSSAGAIYSLDDTIIENCSFNECRATLGGAIYMVAFASIKNSNFTFNYASGPAGAIYANEKIEIYDSSFISNKAGANAGSIVMYDVGKISGCTFANGTSSPAGEIYTTKNLTLENSIFYNGRDVVNSPGDVTFKNNTFFNCTCSGAPGAVLNCNGFGTIMNCSFYDISSTNAGGAIYFSNKGVIRYCNFTNVTSTSVGGAVYFCKDGLVEYSMFGSNSGTSGGAIYFESGGTVKYSNFTNNSAIRQFQAACGGAIYSGGFIDIVNSNFDDNFASQWGGAVYARTANVSNSVFRNNHVELSGGAIFFNTKGFVNCSNFSENIADSQGGAIYFNGIGDVRYSCFHANNALYGGAVYSNDNCTLYNSNFTKNNASLAGGAVYSYEFTEISKSNFYDNYAEQPGGAVYINHYGNVSSSLFANNHAGISGGAIYLNHGAVINGSEFANNIADVNGGAIFFNQLEDEEVTLNNTNFTGNAAAEGGALSFNASGILNGINFISNSADNGGAIITNSDLSLKNSNFKDNYATYQTNHVALIGNGRIILQESVTPEDLSPFKIAEITVVNITDIVSYGQTVNVTVNVTYQGNALNDGIAFVTINNVNYTANVENGTATISMPNLNAGSYDVDVIYSGDAIYTRPSAAIQFSIAAIIISFTIENVSDINYGETLNVSIKFSESITDGEVYVSVNEASFAGKVVDGVATVEISGVDAGTHRATVLYNSLNYLSTAKEFTFTVYKVDSTVEVPAIEFSYGEEGTSIAVLDGATTVVANVINHTEANVEVEGNVITVSGLDVGSYVLNVTTVPDNNHYEATTTANITVNKANSTIILGDVEMDYGSSVNVTVIIQGATGITAEIDGKEVNATGNVITISGLNAGTHRLTVTTIPDDNYNEVNKTVNITVNRIDSSLSVDNVVVDYGSSVNVAVTTQGATGITAEIDGKEVNATGNVITISGLNAGTHTLTVTTIPDENHTSVNKTANITVNKLDSIITASDKAYVINYGGTYEITLKDEKGNVLSGQTVTFALNGKNIGSGVTNANGVASITLTGATLKTAKAGTRNLVVNFAGGTNYNGASKTVKITINKEKTKIAAKKKTFKKSQKVKKYTITLKNSKNKAVKKVKVTLKVKGKTYSAKTSTKGKAIFKIKNLKKKGTFKATIKFKGNNYYNKVTKNVKIKIK